MNIVWEREELRARPNKGSAYDLYNRGYGRLIFSERNLWMRSYKSLSVEKSTSFNRRQK